MALLEVLKFPDPRLRRLSVEVELVTPEIVEFAENMIETMYNFHGIGLAAPQVNRLIRLLVADTRPKDSGSRYEIADMMELEQKVEQPFVIINPVLTAKEGKATYEEGCLSIPSYFETVERYDSIQVEGLNLKGEKFMAQTDGLLSICIQHEIDHLDGKLFIDRLSPIKANRIKSKIKKFGYPKASNKGEMGEEKADL